MDPSDKLKIFRNVMLVFRGCLVSGTSPDLVISQNFKKPKLQPMFLAPLAPLLKEMSLPDRPVSQQQNDQTQGGFSKMIPASQTYSKVFFFNKIHGAP